MCNIELKLEHIQKSYTRPVLTDVNLSVFNESYIAILGKSGSDQKWELQPEINGSYK